MYTLLQTQLTRQRAPKLGRVETDPSQKYSVSLRLSVRACPSSLASGALTFILRSGGNRASGRNVHLGTPPTCAHRLNRHKLEHRRHQLSPPSGRANKRSKLALGTFMDSDLGNSNTVGDISRGSGHSAEDARRTVVEDRFDRGSRSGDFLRRGHSDGDVLPRPQQTFNEQVLEHGETWMDFLRHSGRDRIDQERTQIAIRRAAMMTADRTRRLTGQHIDSVRRRSSSNILFGQLPGGRRRLNMPYPASDHTISPLPVSEGAESRISHGPSFRRPSAGRPRSLFSRDVTLPRWQPDAEVTKCPICGNTFTFWYRKHHCRKCGRVVCANCSPHRITIPRQYIVHPPDQSSPSPTQGTDPAIEVIDLTEDNEDSTRASSQTTERRDRRQSRDGHLDPALGGGQEVRLCNPCVPDPNPLPHLYRSPARFSLDSFPRPESIPQDPSSSIAPPRSSSIQHRRLLQTGMAAPGQRTPDMGQPSNAQVCLLHIMAHWAAVRLLITGNSATVRKHWRGQQIFLFPGPHTVLRRIRLCIM